MPVWPCALSGRLSIAALVGHYPTNKLIDRGLILERIKLSPRRVVCGIIFSFPKLFPTQGQITHVLLTRSPLYSPSEEDFLVRLACVKRAASVDSEPGSNSREKVFSPNTPRVPEQIHRVLPIRLQLEINENVLHVQPICQRSVPHWINSLDSLTVPEIPHANQPQDTARFRCRNLTVQAKAHITQGEACSPVQKNTTTKHQIQAMCKSFCPIHTLLHFV